MNSYLNPLSPHQMTIVVEAINMLRLQQKAKCEKVLLLPGSLGYAEEEAYLEHIEETFGLIKDIYEKKREQYPYMLPLSDIVGEDAAHVDNLLA